VWTAVAVSRRKQELTLPSRTRESWGVRTVREFSRIAPSYCECEAMSAPRCSREMCDGAKSHRDISSGRGVAAAANDRARGVDVSIETCAHSCSTEEDVERRGDDRQVCSPARDPLSRRALVTMPRRGRGT